jgi:hypothetical protein
MNKQHPTHNQTETSRVLISQENPDVADLIHAQRVADAKRLNIPLWLLTRPVLPHMEQSPSELD